MSESGEPTNGNSAKTTQALKADDSDHHDVPPPPNADGVDQAAANGDLQDNYLLSHIVPPSHILADGRYIQLPPPTSLERSAFFERAVAANQLIAADDEREKKIGTKTNDNKRGSGDIGDEESSRGTKKKKKSSDAPYVHPLAIASARLRAKGMDELSKAINLGGLVIGGEYFSLSNVVNQRLNVKDASNSADEKTNGEASGSTSAATSTNEIDESILLDHRLRSKYVLQQRQSQYTNASTVLSRHEKRLSSSISVMRILDNRLQTLRKRWRLVAPEHGTRTVGPVRPREVVAVDVEVYDRDRLGGGSQATTSTTNSTLGRIARRVPRFATMELDDDYDVSVDIKSLRKKITDVIGGLKRVDGDDASDMEVESIQTPNKQSSSLSSSSSASIEVCKTKAEPFAIADPTLGKIDPDFDPNKVPLLTLLFEIEKPSTGFVERATLSSSFLSAAKNGSSDAKDDKRQNLHPDERVIEALQHSLFCASLFESMRAEIIPASSSQSNNTVGAVASQQRQKSVAWLSSEMEESFLPPPSVMAGEDMSRIGDIRLLCVIHCHEGEVKVQLDDEYALTVKLIEAGTAAAAGNVDTSSIERADNGATTKQTHESGSGSGSQSPAQLRTLCKALLLHSQTLYHEHCTDTKLKNASESKKEEEKPVVGFARTKKEAKIPSPRILQSCIGLGCKFIFEKKVRLVLKRLSKWLENNLKCKDTITVEWLPIGLFDSHSQFAILFRNVCLDVGIHGDTLRVSQTSEHGGYRTVTFGSEDELECFLKVEMRRALAK